MNDTHLHRHLVAFILAAKEHQEQDRQYRAAWKRPYERQHIAPQRHKALNATERAEAQIRQTLADLPEPTYLSRTARELLQRWDNYRRNHAIMCAEYHRENAKHTATSRAFFEKTLSETAETIKKLQSDNP